MTDKTQPPARRRIGLLAEIAIVLACKLLFIFGLWYFFFSPEYRTDVTPDKFSEQILGPSTSKDMPIADKDKKEH